MPAASQVWLLDIFKCLMVFRYTAQSDIHYKPNVSIGYIQKAQSLMEPIHKLLMVIFQESENLAVKHVQLLNVSKNRCHMGMIHNVWTTHFGDLEISLYMNFKSRNAHVMDPDLS